MKWNTKRYHRAEHAQLSPTHLPILPSSEPEVHPAAPQHTSTHLAKGECPFSIRLMGAIGVHSSAYLGSVTFWMLEDTGRHHDSPSIAAPDRAMQCKLPNKNGHNDRQPDRATDHMVTIVPSNSRFTARSPSVRSLGRCFALSFFVCFSS